MLEKTKSLAVRIGGFYRRIVNRLLGNTHNHFTFFFPEKSGLLSGALWHLLFSKVSIVSDTTEAVRRVANQGSVVYVTKYRSHLEFLLCNKQFGQNRLPVPELHLNEKKFLLQPVSRILKILLAHTDYFLRHFSFLSSYKTGYFKTELAGGRTAFFSLFGKKPFYVRIIRAKTNPVQELIKIQKTSDRPVYIVPQVILYSKRAIKTKPGLLDFLFGGLAEKPGRMRRLFLLMTSPKRVVVEMTDPVNLKEFLNRPEIINISDLNQALALRRQLLSRINQLRQRVTGPVIKSREEIKESIMAGRRLQQFIESYVAETGANLKETNKEAYAYLDEIASNYSMNWLMVYDAVLSWMLRHIFDGMVVDHKNLEKLKKLSEQAPLIYVPTHKSHLDYLILSYLLYHNNMACPHIAAGKNLSFWPLGPIFRGGGAFFMRRTFKGQPLYARVFLEYIYKILQEGFHIEFFLEGTRSRTGKLLSPKTGLLSIILDAYDSGACRDLFFVPVNIGYDRIIEEAAYIEEAEGGEKKAENLPQLIKARKSLRRRYGKVYVNFNQPVHISRYLAETQPAFSHLKKPERRAFSEQLALVVASRINAITTVTPYAIVSSAILNCQRKRFTYDHLMAIMETYLAFLKTENAPLADTITSDHTHAFGMALDSFAHRKFIEHFEIDKDQQNPLYMVNESKRPAMEYYKNNCICFFIPPAYTALAILELDTLQFSRKDLYKEFEFLCRLFSREFILNVERSTDELIRKSIKGFINNNMLTPHDSIPDTYHLTAEGIRKLKLFAAFLASYMESYQVVLSFINQQEEFPEEKEVPKKVLAYGRKMYKNNEIDRLEAVSKLTFKTAYRFFLEENVAEPDDRTKIDFYTDNIQKYRTLLA